MSLPISLDWFTAPFVHWLALALLHFVWQGLVIAALVGLLLEVARHAKISRRYAICLGGLLTMAACPLATLCWYLLQHSSSDVGTVSQSQAVTIPTLTAPVVISDFLLVSEPYLLTAWAVGVLLLAGRLLVGALGVVRLRQGRLLLPEKIAALAAPIGKRLGVNAEALVFMSREVSEAMAVGFLKPLVLIPATWATEMPLPVLEAVIAHELAHLARHDLWVNGFQRIVETLLFYHPAVWWLSTRVRCERELCTDELAIAATGKRLEYAQALQHIAAQRQADLRPLLAAFIRGDRNMRLLQRVRRVLGQAGADSSRLWPAGFVAAALPLGLWAALAFGPAALADDGDDNLKKPRIRVSRESRDVDTGSADRQIIIRKPSLERDSIEEVIEYKLLDQNGRVLEHKIEGAKPKPRVEVRFANDEPPGNERRLDELMDHVKRLTLQVQRLQDEVAELRGRAGDKKVRIRHEDIELKRRSREQDDQARARQQGQGQKDQLEQIGKQMALREQEIAKQQAAKAKERAADVKNRALQQKERAEQRARVEKERTEQGARVPKEREREEHAIRNKVEAARDKVEAEMKELERKLEKLKEVKGAAVTEDIDIELELVPKLKAKLRDQKALLK